MLVPCVDCGSSVSQSANRCPKCGSAAPHGKICVLCSRSGKQQDMIAGRVGSWARSDESWVHSECVKHLFAKDVPCPDCGELVWAATDWKARLADLDHREDPRCLNCGAANPLLVRYHSYNNPPIPAYLLRCLFCGLPILDRVHKHGTHERRGTEYHWHRAHPSAESLDSPVTSLLRRLFG